jgi:hypothetical protein
MYDVPSVELKLEVSVHLVMVLKSSINLVCTGLQQVSLNKTAALCHCVGISVPLRSYLMILEAVS